MARSAKVGEVRKPAKRAGVADERVHQDLYKAIIDHRIAPGTPLQEDALAKAFGISRKLILAECERAIVEDGSGAIVLGCAGMADLNAYLEDKLGVPVIDGVTAAVKFAEALVSLGLRTSKRGDLAYPLHKPYKGTLSAYAPPDRSHAPRRKHG